jgi:quercetin dioxygenase-like cupin family protein
MKRVSFVLIPVALAITAGELPAQSHGFGICRPRSERAGDETGCFIITEQEQGPLGSRPLFWHVTKFDSRAAAERIRGDREPVIDAFGGFWLMTLGDSAWRPGAGTLVAVIGPLPIEPAKSYTAMYMEASMRPGDKTPVHRHPGPEAWYTLSGQTCLETPTGTQTGRPDGPPVIVAGGQPMELTATGTTVRRSIVLILHESGMAAATMDSTWTPRRLCAR